MGSKGWIAAVLTAMIVLLGTGGTGPEQGKQIEVDASSVPESTETVDLQTVAPQPEEETARPGIGGSHLAYRKCTIQTGEGDSLETETKERGEIGLTYTLERVQVFDSFLDAGLDPERLLVADEAYLANNCFLLVDLKAVYAAPAGGEQTITANAGELSAVYLSDGRTETVGYGMPPTLAYLDLHPEENDTKFDRDRELYFYTIEDGKPVNLRVGIFCGKEYLDSGNVYLEVNSVQEDAGWANAERDAAWKLFALFPGKMPGTSATESDSGAQTR